MSGRHPDQHANRDDLPSYSLDELSSEADVTPRTIRYYIAEGLLPPPISPGRNARYTQEHLDRLRLIAEMKARYLPLKEIRRSITSMSPEQIRREVKWGPDDLLPAQGAITHALEESKPAYVTSDNRSSREHNRNGLRHQQMWKRIPIGDEAELMIMDSAWERRGEQLESAVTWIRQILNE